MTDTTGSSADGSGHRACLICRGSLSLIAADLKAASSRADALYAFTLYACQVCGHVQKGVDQAYRDHLDDVYRVAYSLPGGGRKSNIVEGRVVSREQVLAKALGAGLAGRDHGAVLDVGAGMGHLLAAFARELPGFDIVGYDLNDDKEAVIRAGGATHFYSGRLDAVPASFDLITFNHVLEHLTDPVTVLKQASALLKPDGWLAVIVPCYKAVYTDFFFLEHCSHFTEASLNVVAAMAGLSISDRLEAVVGLTEIGFVARRAERPASPTPVDAVRWAQSLPGVVRSAGAQGPVGVFGVNGAGMWLGAIFSESLAFYVDEDPAKQGASFAGRPIIGVADIPAQATVVVAFNNPEASARMRDRLCKLRPDVAFLAPP